MDSHNGILILGELAEGKVATITRELLNAGRRLGNDLNQPVSILLIAEGKDLAKEAILLGADRVYIFSSPPFASSVPDHYLDIFKGLCRQMSPSIILLGQTDTGREIAPRLAARLEASVVMDCIEIEIDSGSQQLRQTKPVYGGNAVAVWVTDLDKPAVVTLRPRAIKPAEPDSSRKGEILNFSFAADKTYKTRLVEVKKEESKNIKLEDAKVIVAGGGGIGGSQGFVLLEELADVLGGTIGVTRVPCDEKWMPISLEIGQTGHIVSPNLYIAVGISGAPQHMSGCSGSKCVVAINRDQDAHIFKESDFGVIGDYKQILPALVERCRAIIK